MALPSVAKFIFAKFIACTTSLNDASKLCFGAATGCFVVGTMGWLINFVEPGTTMLHGLLVVAVFYFALGVTKLFEKQSGNSLGLGPVPRVDDPLLAHERNVKQKEKSFKSAA